jgi:hypothetical protein
VGANDDKRDSADVRDSFGCLLWIFGPLALLIGLFAYQYYKQRGAAWIVAAAIALVWGVMFARWPWYLVGRQRELSRGRVPAASDDEINTTTHVRTLDVNVPAAVAYDVALAWIRRFVMGVRFKESDRDRGRIHGRTWDCHILVQVTPLTDGSANVRIEGRPRRFQLFDDGKNLGNVVELEKWLRDHTASEATIDGHAGAPDGAERRPRGRDRRT